MPKPSKRAADTSDSDSGPDDRGPVKKGAAAGSSSAAKKPRGNPAVDGQEPTWELGNNKKVKVRTSSKHDQWRDGSTLY